MFLKTDVADTRNKIDGQGDDLKHGVGAERGCSEFFYKLQTYWDWVSGISLGENALLISEVIWEWPDCLEEREQ